MTRCNNCDGLYPHDSHYGICANTFGKCVDCMVKSGEMTEDHLNQIMFLSGDVEPINKPC